MRTAQQNEAEALVRLARERSRYEQAVMRRFGGTLTVEDAEDVVSEALLRSTDRCPANAPDGGRAWFTRVVLNRAEDFRRARDGRPRSARQRNSDGPAISRRFVSFDESAEAAARVGAEPSVYEHVESALNAAEARRVVADALAALNEDEAAALRLRHLESDGDGLARQEAADRMGLPLWRFDALYSTAWRRFTRALISAAATDECRTMRRALMHAPRGSRPRRLAEFHLTACRSCQAFERRDDFIRSKAA